jgi:hypothetical protein
MFMFYYFIFSCIDLTCQKNKAYYHLLIYLMGVVFLLENGEDIQVLRYMHGEKYEPHYDYFTDKVNTIRGGHRTATVLVYLTDVAEGGETVSPQAEVKFLVTGLRILYKVA